MQWGLPALEREMDGSGEACSGCTRKGECGKLDIAVGTDIGVGLLLFKS